MAHISKVIESLETKKQLDQAIRCSNSISYSYPLRSMMKNDQVRKDLLGGTSYPVTNVQALASNYSGDIPLRFHRPELHSEEVLVDESLQIPTIDMNKLMVEDEDDNHEIGKLHLACKEWGFFQVLIIFICLFIF